MSILSREDLLKILLERFVSEEQKEPLCSQDTQTDRKKIIRFHLQILSGRYIADFLKTHAYTFHLSSSVFPLLVLLCSRAAFVLCFFIHFLSTYSLSLYCFFYIYMYISICLLSFKIISVFMHLSKFCSASFLFCTMRLLRCFQYSLNASFFSLLYLVTP